MDWSLDFDWALCIARQALTQDVGKCVIVTAWAEAYIEWCFERHPELTSVWDECEGSWVDERP